MAVAQALRLHVVPIRYSGSKPVLPEDDVPGTPWSDSTSFIGVPRTFDDDASLFSVIAHELNHASQFALDDGQDDAFFEHTAVFVERLVAHHVPEYGVGIGAVLAYQHLSESGNSYLIARSRRRQSHTTVIRIL